MFISDELILNQLQGYCMRTTLSYFVIAGILIISNCLNAQEVKASNADKWSVSGLIQLQHSASTDIAINDEDTNNGFRIRTGRLQVKSQLNEYVSAKFQIEVRDNDPRLKDAEGKLKMFDQFSLRFGQFKVPVWREELRSSGKLLLVERSAAAEFLTDMLLSARHVGVEFGGEFENGINFAINYSNGAGEGGREDAGTSKHFDVNNGKLFSGRINVYPTEVFQIALSGAVNQLGTHIGGMDHTGIIYAIAPDFGVYLESGLDVEGGVALGKISKELEPLLDEPNKNQQFMVGDVTACLHLPFSQPNTALAGMDGVEIAAGISYIEPNSNIDKDETIYLRVGPAFNFGKHTRIQVNGELAESTAEGAESFLIIRSQATFNF